MKKMIGSFLTAVLFCGFIVVFSGCAYFSRYGRYDHSDEYSVGSGSIAAAEIHRIEIDWISGPVIVESSETATEIEFSEMTSLSEPDLLMHYRLRNGLLDIKFAASNVTLPRNMHKSLTVKIPFGVELNDLNIDSVSGSINVTEITSYEISIDTTSGDVAVSGGEAQELHIDTTSGNINVVGVQAHEISIDTMSGDVVVSGGEAQELHIDTTSGDINVLGIRAHEISVDTTSGNFECKNSEFLQLEVDTTSGDTRLSLSDVGFRCEFDSTSGELFDSFGTVKKRDVYEYGDCSIKIKVESGSGDLFLIPAKEDNR